MPGHRFWAPTIESIDPTICCSYNNVVIMCGINNIKKPEIRGPQDIDRIYESCKAKVSEIRLLNPKCKIFICPILPTKSHELNKGALYFNKLIFSDLIQGDLNVQYVHGFDSFLDDAGSGLLASNLSRQFDRHGKLDTLHLNRSGIRILAGFIKQSVFAKFNSNRSIKYVGSNRVNGRPHSGVLESSRSAPRAGGSSQP